MGPRPQKRRRTDKLQAQPLQVLSDAGERIREILGSGGVGGVTLVKLGQMLCVSPRSASFPSYATRKGDGGGGSCYYEQPPLLSPGGGDGSSSCSGSLSASLRNLISPLDEGTFLRHCFRQCAVHVPALPPARAGDGGCYMAVVGEDGDGGQQGDHRLRSLREQLFDLDPGSILRSTSSENIFVWLRSSGNEDAAAAASRARLGGGREQHDSPSGLIHSIEVPDAETALALYNAGHATYCRAPESLERHLVSSLLADTGLGCGQYDPPGESSTSLGRGEVEVFMSPRGHVTDWHYDFQENFTIQLSGSKRWTLQKGSVRHPLRGCTPHYRSPESVEPQLKAAHLSGSNEAVFQFRHPVAGINAAGEKHDVIAKPGDVLYFPAGMWHKVEVIEPGVSINISLMAANYATVTCQALQHLLLKREEWREAVVSNSTTNVIERLKTLLHELPGIIHDFEREGGGAEAIIPPAVRQGEAIRLPDEEDDGSEEDEDEGHDEIVDVQNDAGRKKAYDRYQCTEEQVREQLQRYRVVRNPLATLLRATEIYRFYKTPCDDEDEECDGEMMVLNVNYAGNEIHESVVRKRIKERGMLLSHVYSKSKNAANNTEGPNADDLLPPLDDWVASEIDRSMLGCLVYYGYLLWVERDPDMA